MGVSNDERRTLARASSLLGELTTRGLLACLSSLRPRILFNTAITAAAARSPVPTRPMSQLLFSGLLFTAFDEVQLPMQTKLETELNIDPGRDVMLNRRCTLTCLAFRTGWFSSFFEIPRD